MGKNGYFLNFLDVPVYNIMHSWGVCINIQSPESYSRCLVLKKFQRSMKKTVGCYQNVAKDLLKAKTRTPHEEHHKKLKKSYVLFTFIYHSILPSKLLIFYFILLQHV